MKPRELSEEECKALLLSARYGRLGLSRDDQPYVVPMSFVYHDGKIYLHSRGGAGRSSMPLRILGSAFRWMFWRRAGG